jgi:hypothetical protein
MKSDVYKQLVDIAYGDSDKIGPIYDGIVDNEVYQAADIKVMWVLKEPYDCFDEAGQPYGVRGHHKTTAGSR